MYFLSNTAVTFLVSFLYTQISLVSCFNCKGDDYVLVKPYLTCKKIYNCRPGYEILDCDRQCELLKCVKCADGYVQPDLIHWDSTHKTCFKKTEQHTCTEGITYAHPDEVIRIRSCPTSRYCKCNNDECSYGPDPCQCSHSDSCQENETLDGKSGGCIPCPSGYLSTPGCGACFKDTRKKVETTTVPVHVMSTEHTEAAAKSRFIHKLTTESSNKRSNSNIVTYLVDDDVNNMEIEESSQNGDDNSAFESNEMLIGIITGLVLLVICSAAVMIIKYQRGNRQQAMINDEEEGHEMDIVPRDHQNLRADHFAYLPNGRLPRNNPGCVDHVKEPETWALLNGIGHRNNNGNGVHQNNEDGGQRQTHSGPATIGARRNKLYLQKNREIDCDGGNESSVPSEKDIDPEHFHLQRTLNIKEGSHGSHTAVIVAARPDISEAGCPVASPSSAINPYEIGASGTSSPLGGGSLGVDMNRQTHRQESRSDNNKPIASPSDTQQQDSSSNSNDEPLVNHMTTFMRKKQVRFGEGNDLQLLREVIAKNPFKDRSKWTEIAETLPIDCDARRVRERTLLLVNQHKGKNAESKKKSGIDEAYGEKDQLLDEVLEISEEEEISKKAEKEKAREFEQAGKNIRKRAMETLCKSDEENTPKKSSSRDSVLSYLREKSEAENKTKEKEIEMKKKELELKEKEVELQREKFEMERAERKQQSDIMTQLLKALIEKK